METESDDLGLVDGLVQLSFLVQSVLARTAAAHDITVPQLRLLGILRDREPGMLQLARHLGLDKSSVTGLIDRAERRGLVRRTSTTEDGRVVLVCATTAGRTLTRKVNAEVGVQIDALGRTLTPEDRKMFISLVSHLISRQTVLPMASS